MKTCCCNDRKFESSRHGQSCKRGSLRGNWWLSTAVWTFLIPRHHLRLLDKSQLPNQTWKSLASLHQSCFWLWRLWQLAGGWEAWWWKNHKAKFLSTPAQKQMENLLKTYGICKFLAKLWASNTANYQLRLPQPHPRWLPLLAWFSGLCFIYPLRLAWPLTFQKY